MSEQKEPYNFLKGITELVPIVFETKFWKVFEPKKKNSFENIEVWGKELAKIGLKIDLSQVRWVDFGAAAQLTLLIEWTQKNKIAVSILLPLTRLSQGEQRHLKDLENSNLALSYEKRKLFEALVKGRNNAFKYLELIGFIEAVKCQHLLGSSNVSFNYEYDFQSGKTKNQKQVDNPSRIRRDIEDIERTSKNPTEIGYKRIIPLTWIDKFGKNDTQDKEDFENYEKLIDRILSNAEQGLEHIDAKTITNVILHELTKNLKEHAETSHALVGCVLQTTNALNSENYSDCEREYFEWFKISKSNYISIYFGDTGQGLIATLNKAERKPKFVKKAEDFIHWSFDKWSTSKSKELIIGTKGLYRVLRIINKYDGLVTIRTSDTIAGFQKGGNVSSSEIKTKNKYTFFPGTFLRLHLVPFKEIIKLNINPYYKNTDPSDKRFVWITSHLIIESQLNKDKSFGLEYIRNLLFEAQSNNIKGSIINLLLIIQIDTNKVSSLEIQKEILNEVFTLLSLTRHPGAIALYLISKPNKISWDFIESEIKSFNSLRIREKESNVSKEVISEDVFDPVLILGENRQFGWIGDEHKDILDILTNFYTSGSDNLNLNIIAKKFEYSNEHLSKIKQFFYGDEALAYIKENNDIILRFNFQDLKEYFNEKLRKNINELNELVNESSDYYLTPNLKVVRNWISINNDILKLNNDSYEELKNYSEFNKYGEVNGYALALSTLMKDNLRELPDILKDFKLIIDNYECEPLAIEFAKFNGIAKEKIIKLYEEVDGRLPRRNAIFDKIDKVIILTTIISSKETIIRSIKTILRDSATPIAVISLINASKRDTDGVNYNEFVWGKEIKFISILNQPELFEYSNEKNSTPTYYIEPFSYEKVRVNEDINKIDNNNFKVLDDLITTCDALHFNHVGNENGRHFTFYLSAKRLFNYLDQDGNYKTEITIIDKYIKEIDQWMNEENISNFEIWKISHEIKHAHPASTISVKILDHYREKCKGNIEIQRSGAFGEMKYSLPLNYNTKSQNVIFIDWGTMTGTTIQQVIKLTPGIEKKKVLCCILFNQLSCNESIFLSKISQVTETIEKSEDIQNQLKLFVEPKQKIIKSETKVSIKFLYDLPLFYYEQLECPVCEHRQALREFVIQAPYMDDFFNKRREILKIKDRKITDEKPVDFYGVDDNYRIHSTSIFRMFKFKWLLKMALTSTHYRNEVKNIIFKITDNNTNDLEFQKKDIDSDLYAILYFLSVEIMWMQKPPLSFQLLRTEITKMAIAIAIWDAKEMQHSLMIKDEIVIRYKFAAISVLRSSNKGKFIENIESIFRSSFLNDQVSKSLSQNLFYHIHSYLKREYHTSESQFDKIINELEKILDQNPQSEVKNVLQFLLALGNKKKFSQKVAGMTKLETIRSLKKQISEYWGITSHNVIYDNYRLINPNLIDLKNRIQNKNLDLNYIENRLKIWIKNLQPKWGLVSGYINNVCHIHLIQLKSLFESKIFKDYYIPDYFEIDTLERETIGWDDELTKIIKRIPNEFNDMRLVNRFQLLYNKYFINVISSKKFDNEIEDSTIIKFANEFPAQIQKTLLECLERLNKDDPCEIIINDDNIKKISYKVFYPKSSFEFAIDNILANIPKHYNKSSKQIKIWFDYEVKDKFIHLFIFNTGTVDVAKKNNGCIQQIIDELKFFDGVLTTDFNMEIKQVHLKLMLYE